MPDLPRILLIDDEPAVHRGVAFSLRGFGDVTGCTSVQEALERIRVGRFDAALVDVNLGEGLSGIQLVARIGEEDPDLATIVFTAHTDYKTVSEALRVHSFDFVPKSLRDDDELRTKVDRAVERTREQRARTQGIADVHRLRSSLLDACAECELELTTGDIQRGLLGESTATFSSILGRTEWIEEKLRREAISSPKLVEISQFAANMVAELKEYVGRMRDYFAEPERASGSVNEILSRAARKLEEEASGMGASTRIECAGCRPDQGFPGDGRALLRTIVILGRLFLRKEGKGPIVSIKASYLFNPLVELDAARKRSNVCILRTSNFRKIDKTAIGVEVAGPCDGLSVEKISTLFAPGDPGRSAGSPWAALAMLARMEGALIAEAKPASVRYQIIVRA